MARTNRAWKEGFHWGVQGGNGALSLPNSPASSADSASLQAWQRISATSLTESSSASMRQVAGPTSSVVPQLVQRGKLRVARESFRVRRAHAVVTANELSGATPRRRP
jgi:hypothetical protein